MKTWRLILSLLLAWACTMAASAAEEKSARALVQQGSTQLVAGEINESIESFEKAIALEPNARPYLWQLGIAYYYAGRFREGRDLFEAHQTVNSNDVENAVWHFLCTARAENIETARKKLIPISGDARVPMKEIHALFAGSGTENSVLEAASSTAESSRRNAFCYAHLYLALYHEALGKDKESREHIQKAATEFKQDHYMGKIAELHARLRTKSTK